MRAPLLSRSHRRRSQREFSPRDISGLQLWFDFSDPTTVFTDSAKTTLVLSDGDVIGAIEDKSEGNDATQATTANKPIYKTGIQNGLSIARFDGADDLLNGSLAHTLTQPATIFAVVALDTAAVNDSTNRWVTGGDGSKRLVLFQRATDTPDSFSIFGGTALGGSDSDDSWHVWSAFFNGVSSEFWIDGVSKASGNAGDEEPTEITIGASAGPNNFWDGDIAEVLIYDSMLSTANRQLIENFLNNKWAVF